MVFGEQKMKATEGMINKTFPEYEIQLEEVRE